VSIDEKHGSIHTSFEALTWSSYRLSGEIILSS